jgi:hypothetical protein
MLARRRSSSRTRSSQRSAARAARRRSLALERLAIRSNRRALQAARAPLQPLANGFLSGEEAAGLRKMWMKAQSADERRDKRLPGS